MARLAIQFPERTTAALTEMSQREKATKTEILRRALALYRYLGKETQDGKHKVVITDENGKIMKEIVMTR